MSGSGTDRSKPPAALDGPVVILVEPQLGENIGMCARAMGNFGLTRLRLVKPRDGWPNVAAQRSAAGADDILDAVELFETVEQAVFAEQSADRRGLATAPDEARDLGGQRAGRGGAAGHGSVRSSGGAMRVTV